MAFPPYNSKAINFHEKLYCTFSHVVIVVMEKPHCCSAVLISYLINVQCMLQLYIIE